MLLNPRYKGYYTANLTYVESYKTHKKVEVPEDERIIYKDEKISAIVSEELWDKANEVYKSKRNLRNINNLNKQEYLDNSKYTSKKYVKKIINILLDVEVVKEEIIQYGHVENTL